MTKQAIIEQTLKAIQQLPENQAKEISDFAQEVMDRYQENQLQEDIQAIYAKNKAFDFLAEEEDLYSEADLKEIYHEKR